MPLSTKKSIVIKQFLFFIQLKWIVIGLVLAFTTLSVKTQYNFIASQQQVSTEKFRLFSFKVSDSISDVRMAFFAKNPFEELLKLQNTSKILYASSASFVFSKNIGENIPVGFCAQNGKILNKMPSQDMDGLVIIENKSQNSVKIIDLDHKQKPCDLTKCESHFLHSNIRDNASDVFPFLSGIENNELSCFQTQLVYSKLKTDVQNFKSLYNGYNNRTRRFLAICNKDGSKQHVIVDALEMDFLMSSAKRSVDYLRSLDYDVEYMLNLDTGSKDIMHVHNGNFLENQRPETEVSSAKIEQASSLLVYYTKA